MKLNEMYILYFENIKVYNEKIFNDMLKNSSSILEKTKDNIINQIKDGLNLKSKIKKDLENDLLENLNVLIKSLNDMTIKNIKDIIDKTNEVILFTIKSPFFDEKIYINILNKYKLKIKSLIIINDKFINSFNSIFDLFLYKFSLEYKLKNNISEYNLMVKKFNQNKKILLDNLDDINKNTKNMVEENYESNFLAFIEEAIDLRNDVSKKNKDILINYSKDILQNKLILKTNKILKDNYLVINEILKSTHEDILILEKAKNKKEHQESLTKITDYFINFNNTLFDKSLNVIKEMIETINYDKKNLDKKINKYSESVYKIIDFDFCFERQFLTYKKELTSRKMLTSKTINNIDSKLKTVEDEIIKIIKKSIISLFKESITELSDVSYKVVMLGLKLDHTYELIETKKLKNLFIEKDI